ncbi:MAG: rhomboid family intramembrane serine protease [Tannerellaceae bacterium]|nr:rhomboid family intramembrane serine protease [Tannerellaceae bacterium]
MKDSDIKYRFIYSPFLICSVGVIGGYTLLRWFFNIYLEAIISKDFVLNIILPFIVSTLVLWTVLRKRIKILEISEKQEDFTRIIAVLTMAIPTILLQFYVVERAKTLYEVDNINDIEKVRMTDCFRIKHMEVLPQFLSMDATNKVTGRYNDNMNFSVYVVAPLIDPEEGLTKHPRFWYGYKEVKQMSNRKEYDELNKAFQQLQENTVEKFKKINFPNYKYLEVVNYSDDRDFYLSAIRDRFDVNTNDVVILEARNEVFNNSGSGKMKWVCIAFAIGALIFAGLTFNPAINTKVYKQLKDTGRLENDTMRDIIQYLTFQTLHRTVPLLINLNLLVFLVMIVTGVHFINPLVQDVVDWGGMRAVEFFAGDYWRPLTAMFIHVGIMHLVCNIFGLWILGESLENAVGAVRLLIVYILSGIGSFLISLWLDPHNTGVTVGASGAIFGLIGLMIVVCIRKIYSHIGKGYIGLIIVYGGINLIAGALTPQISNTGQMAGLATGFVISWFVTTGVPKE